MVYLLTNDEPIHVQPAFVVAKLVHRLLLRSFPVYHTVEHAPRDFTESHSYCHGISPSTFRTHRATDLLHWTVCRYRWGRLTHCHGRATAQLYHVPLKGNLYHPSFTLGSFLALRTGSCAKHRRANLHATPIRGCKVVVVVTLFWQHQCRYHASMVLARVFI